MFKVALRGKMSKHLDKPGLKQSIMGYLMIYSSSSCLLLPLQDLRYVVLKIYSSEERYLNERGTRDCCGNRLHLKIQKMIPRQTMRSFQTD